MRFVAVLCSLTFLVNCGFHPDEECNANFDYHIERFHDRLCDFAYESQASLSLDHTMAHYWCDEDNLIIIEQEFLLTFWEGNETKRYVGIYRELPRGGSSLEVTAAEETDDN
jgi:hypothetical protein